MRISDSILRAFLLLVAAALGSACSGLGNDGDVVPSDQLTENEAELLRLHNMARESAPTAGRGGSLEPLQWDASLARVAATYASACRWGHNPDRSVQYGAIGGGGYVGENLAARWGSGQLQLEGMFMGWANEEQFYNYEANSCRIGEVCGHYTQLVWRDTERVGCAWSRCDELVGISGARDAWYLVCNYAPGGNYTGQRPY